METHMATSRSSTNSVAIVAIIVVGLLIAGAGVLFYSGALDNNNTTVIKAPGITQGEPGFSLKFDNKDGVKTEITTD